MTANTELIGGDRPIRGCDVCGGVDDHPRHVIAGAPGAAGDARADVIRLTIENSKQFDDATRDAVLASILDTSSQDRHRDCCRQVGCPTGTCNDVVDVAGPDVRGAELLAATEQHADTIAARTASRLEG